MSYKIGMLRRLKSCYYIMAHPDCKNVPILSCDMCGSINIVRVTSDTIDKSTDSRNIKETSSRHLCLNCKAECNDVQVWSRHKDIEMLRQGVFECTNKEGEKWRI